MSATPEDWKPGAGAWLCGYVKQWDEKGGRTISVDVYRAEVLREVADSIRENFAYCEDPNGSGTCCGVANVLAFIHSEAERDSASPDSTET